MVSAACSGVPGACWHERTTSLTRVIVPTYTCPYTSLSGITLQGALVRTGSQAAGNSGTVVVPTGGVLYRCRFDGNVECRYVQDVSSRFPSHMTMRLVLVSLWAGLGCVADEAFRAPGSSSLARIPMFPFVPRLYVLRLPPVAELRWTAEVSF